MKIEIRFELYFFILLIAKLRVSGIMTNAPIILTLDCDMYSNDPSTPKRALCYFLDQYLWPKLAYIQTPQHFHGLNRADIYASEFKISGPN